MPQAVQALAEAVASPVLDAIIDLDRYPIHQPENPLTLALVEQCRAELDAVGCCCVRGFIRPESIARMLGGEKISASAVAHARELLQTAESRRQKAEA